MCLTQIAPTAAMVAEVAEATGAAMELLVAVGGGSGGPAEGGPQGAPSSEYPSVYDVLPTASSLSMLARSMVQLGIAPDDAWQVRCGLRCDCVVREE